MHEHGNGQLASLLDKTCARCGRQFVSSALSALPDLCFLCFLNTIPES